MQLRYGNKPLELKNGKSTVQLDSQEALLPTLKEPRAAIVDGELDKLLMAAKKERAGSWKRAKKQIFRSTADLGSGSINPVARMEAAQMTACLA